MSKVLGEKLKKLVKKTGLEQQEIAQRIGMKVPTFNGYVSSNREPSVEGLMKLAAFFNVTVDYLVGHSDIENPYLQHLSEEQRRFISEPENKTYVELAMDIKQKTQDQRQKLE